jgi:hypothetical protein
MRQVFSSDLGKKVTIERPSIIVEEPPPNAFLTDTVTFKGKATAYIKVQDVQIRIFKNEENGQRDSGWVTAVPWETTPDENREETGALKLEGNVKNKTWTFKLNTKDYNNWDFTNNQVVRPKDGNIKIQFRVHDTKGTEEKTPEIIYTIKNNPSTIKMTNPEGRMLVDVNPEKVAEVSYGGEIQGQVIDSKGLMPGFPQIKIWPELKFPGDTEPADDDPQWGWVTLFLPGTGMDSVESESTDREAGPGYYADRRNLPVVRSSNFSYLLAEHEDIVVVDPEYPEWRQIRYIVENGRHKPYGAGDVYKFRIRTRDTNSDPKNKDIPILDPDYRPLEGWFPPENFGDPLFENSFHQRPEPARVNIFSADSRPTIEINNDDIKADSNLGQKALDSKPNIWITEPTSKKIAVAPSAIYADPALFRLQLYINHPNGIKEVALKYFHESSGRSGELSWNTKNGIDYDKPELPELKGGRLYAFTALSSLKDTKGNAIFTSSSDPYILTVLVTAKDETVTDSRFIVYMDGQNPNVSIRSIKGAYSDPINLAEPQYNGLINQSPYVVNGNIQVTVDRTDDSGIMAFRTNGDMGKAPPSDMPPADGYPMVKWVLEKATKDQPEPPDSDSMLEKLIKFKNAPSADNLKFFNDIEDSRTNAGASGWVRRPYTDPNNPTSNPADNTHNFKINSLPFDGQYLWLYVIAQDQVQNLGWIAQKIYVDQNTDKPVVDIPLLFEENASGAKIDDNTKLDVTVTVTNTGRTMSGNWSEDTPRRNILDKDSNIEVNIRDDDGIDLTDNGVTITLTVLDPTTDPGKKTVTFTSDQLAKAPILKSPIKNKRDISLLLSQEIMAEALGVLDVDDGAENHAHATKDKLNDGIYKIEFAVKDDIKEKVEITPNQIQGDKPETASMSIVYYFAVSTQLPKVTVIRPDDNAWGSEEPIDINGTVRSRFTMQHAWITFTPDVTTPTNPNSSSFAISLPLYADAAYSGTEAVSDEDGYYTYYWKKEGVVFHPIRPKGDPGEGSAYFSSAVRRFEVEAYDRLGNKGNEVRSVQIDAVPPSVVLSDYNHSRPDDTLLNPAGEPYNPPPFTEYSSYLYGKVSFTVSATDENGLYEVDGKSGIKWWVVPVSDPADTSKDPKWGTVPTDYTKPTVNVLPATAPSSWTGGGNFTLNQSKGGRYTWVIDTRYLENGKMYKLCIIALDKAGNQSRIVLERDSDSNPTKTTNAYVTFIVDQDRDYPTIDANSLDPLQNQVKGKGATISGTVSDADLFNNMKIKVIEDKKYLQNKYVEIRFSTGLANGVPTWSDNWITVNIPETYSSMNGGIDPSGAIAFKYTPPAPPENNATEEQKYLFTDGIKYYQIRVTDEPDGPSDAEKDKGAKWYGKNPDEFMRDNTAYPNYPYVKHDKVSIIFPSESTSYSFIVDDTDPEIFFNKFDPTLGHPNYTAARPTFSSVELLIEALNGYVKEYKLSDLSMSYTGKVNGVEEIFRKAILNTPKDPETPGIYNWNLKDGTTEFELKDKFDLDGADNLFKLIFNDKAQQGQQIITFTATDMVPRTSRVSYVFAKDTQGPDINFNNISRSIKRPDVKNSAGTIVPGSGIPASPGSGETAWPTNWASDWPLGRWDGTTATWRAWNATWRAIIEYWPSEYAFREATAIISALTIEHNRLPSTVIGDPEPENSGQPGYKPPDGYSPPVIAGTFSDEYSSIRKIAPEGVTPDPTYFYYRFKDKTGKLLDIPSGMGVTPPSLKGSGNWIQKEIEDLKRNPDGTVIPGQNERTAEWKIELDKYRGFTGVDGENWVDICVEDTAGNVSDIYNVRFLVDRTAPKLGTYDPAKTGNDIKFIEVTNPNVPQDDFIVKSLYKGATRPSPMIPVIPGKLQEIERVFSGEGDATSDDAFTLTGTVSDANFSGMTITIGQEGYSAYTVTVKLVMEPTTGVWSAVDSDNTTPSRLTLTKLADLDDDGTPAWLWTLKVLQKDVKELREAAGASAADSARRFIRVTAEDKAGKRVEPVDWFFYLDIKKPELEYTNLEKGEKTNASSFENESFTLSGLVSDDTRIRDVQYMIGRWDYKDSSWKWYNGSTWALNDPLSPTDSTKPWPSVFASDESPTRQTSMNWTINQTTLTAAKPANTFPDKLFEQEGYYRLDLYVTDYSLGNGNPHYTYNKNEPTLVPPFSDTNYSSTKTMSGRVFYIDKKDPTLQWGWVDWDSATNKWVPDPADTYNTNNKTYFRNDGGQAKFSFTVGDGNTIQSWEVKVVDNSTGKTTLSKTNTSIEWEAGKEKGTTLTSTPIPSPATAGGVALSLEAIDNQKLVVSPFMTKNGTSSGDPLDKDEQTPTYTITITVKDGANRTSSISKQFTLDNTPPRFLQDKFQPPTYEFGTASAAGTSVTVTTPSYNPPGSIRSYSYDAVAGRMNIRGNTEDNSNQIRRVAFYLPPAGKDGNANTAYTFPQPKDITKDATTADPNGWHWYDPAAPDKSEVKIGNATLLRIEEGNFFAWRIIVPQTSLLKSTTNDYVQWTTTGGIPISGGSTPAAAGSYQDVSITNYETFAVNTTRRTVPQLEFADLADKKIYGKEPVGLLTVYVLAEDIAGNTAYDVLKYWIWPEGDRPIVTSINNPDASKIEAERLLNGTIRLSGMAKDNERVQYVWFRVIDTETGLPYTNLQIPRWDENTWEAVKTAPLYQDSTGEKKFPKDLADLGDRRTDEKASIAKNTGGWYMANGGGSRDVSWWAYINANGELDPKGNDLKKQFTVEVRAQDTTWDDTMNNNQGGWMEYSSTYKGLASIPMTTNAWVVAGAPIFEKVLIAPDASDEADARGLWDTLDNLNIRNRSAYKVTVKHSSGLSAIHWSPTFWDKSLNGGVGGFQANPKLETVNLLALDTTTPANPEYWIVTRTGPEAYATTKALKNSFFTDMIIKPGTNATPRMAVTVKPPETKRGSVSNLKSTGRQYLIFNWDPDDAGNFVPNLFDPDDSYYETVNGVRKLKNLKNTVLTSSDIVTNATVNIGKTVLIESAPESDGKGGTIEYFKWDVIVDVRADLLLADMIADDPNYGRLNAQGLPNPLPGREGQVQNSVRYPVYLSASEVSKANPLTSRGDSLLPIDNLRPTGQYTLNRRPAGSAATIGGTAEDPGPVNGIARVVLWFQRVGGTNKFISWHEQGTGNLAPVSAEMTNYPDNKTSPAWWDAIGQPGLAIAAGGVIPTGVRKPSIPDTPDVGTGADWAIVIDRNSPSKGTPRWGHTLPMGFADGGRYWYVEIDSLGMESGPVDLHYVVMDKAGNAKYYKERLVIMNGVAVISRIKLGTDIRHNSGLGFGTNTSGNTGTALAASPILDKIRAGVPLGTTDVEKGISDWVSTGTRGTYNIIGANNIVDFNVRNNVFALRVETINPPGKNKQRHFRLEYVSGATLITNAANGPNNLATGMKAGRVYIINDPGTATWGAIGAEGDTWQRGYAFIAAINGREKDEENKDVDKITGIGSAWELNSSYYNTSGARNVPAALALPDVNYNTVADANAVGAEFVYGTGAFGAGNIIDYTNDNDAWPPNQGTNPVTATTASPAGAGNSMFILRVFDGDEGDLFGDFTLLRVRVNNNDRTKPFAQLYDINPKTEGQERQNVAANEERRSVSPMFIGEGTGSNRTKGGLWNIAPALGAVEKPGHIEPRKITYNITPYSTQQHSLSSAQMGGATTKESATIQKPWADPAGFFTTDTVSGRVVLRGYAEDDQRVHQVVLTIGTAAPITILDFQAHAATGAGAGNAANSATYESPKTGLLQIPTAQAGKVYFTDSIDAYRHRVEWAYIWDTETTNGGSVAGNNVNVRVTSYNRTGTGTTRKDASDELASPGTAHTNTSAVTRPNTSPFNKEFPVGLNKYNSISFNLRPYITGFLRDKSLFAHDTRSRQGWYMLARGETAVVRGFNLGTGSITINNIGNTTSGVTAANIGKYGIAAVNDNHYRQFTMGAGATTGNGVVTYSTAVNTGTERGQSGGRPTYIQPWNKEYSPGKDGTELWDDYTQMHIWQSNDTGPGGGDPGRFFVRDNGLIMNPAMSIDPNNGTLYESHNESGSGGNGWYNAGSTKKSGIDSSSNETVTQFSDPVFFSDVYRSPGSGGNGAYTWAVSSIIGRSSTYDYWRALGGIFINGAGGGPIAFHGGGTGSSNDNPSAMNSTYSSSLYHGESTWYNASADNSGRQASPPSTDQFMNPHIVTSYTNDGREHIHVSYYDDKDGSIKYRYNRRGYPGTIDLHSNQNNGGTTNPNYSAANVNAVPKMWTNLDGGVDAEDTDATTWIQDTGSGGAIASGARVVRNGSRGAVKAGKHNSIAVTSQGYPVIAYYDETNQRLKLAVSRSASPVEASNWVIRDYVIPRNNNSSFGTGEFVSMKIDTKDGANRVHIAAMNTSKRLVYVTGILNPTAGTGNALQDENSGSNVLTGVTVQVVDSVGSVGRWCALSLDRDGNPWISYMDESYVGSRDGVKVAFKNTTNFYKGVTGGAYFPGKYIDVNGASLEGWETMHVPTTYRVENSVEGPGREHGRLGMECFPTRNVTTGSTKAWNGAVGYVSQDAAGSAAAMDRYRVAYYMK